jgi:hypothetical protein
MHYTNNLTIVLNTKVFPERSVSSMAGIGRPMEIF